jgi:hypothetical protein
MFHPRFLALTCYEMPQARRVGLDDNGACVDGHHRIKILRELGTGCGAADM